MRWGTAHHHPKPAVVVAGVWVIVVPGGNAGVVPVVEPRTTAQHAPGIAAIHFINIWSVSLIAAPFSDIAVEIVQV
jgi:hypothetical protein